MLMIHINNWISFSPIEGVMVNEEAVQANPEELHEAITAAFQHKRDPELMDACGGLGPLQNFDDLPYEEYIAMKKTFDAVREANAR